MLRWTLCLGKPPPCSLSVLHAHSFPSNPQLALFELVADPHSTPFNIRNVSMYMYMEIVNNSQMCGTNFELEKERKKLPQKNK